MEHDWMKYIYTYRCLTKVGWVIDGDTLDAQIQLGFSTEISKRIRLMGIDTPESRTSNRREKELGLASKTRLKQLIDSSPTIKRKNVEYKELAISTETIETGKYGRVLAYLWICRDAQASIGINKQLIKENHARPYYGGSKDEFGAWTIEKNCSHNCKGKRLTRGRVCDGSWERWTPDGYISF